jgi:hypothetical protein
LGWAGSIPPKACRISPEDTGGSGGDPQEQRKEEIRIEMDNAVHAYRDKHGPDRMVLQLHQFVKEIDSYGLFEDGQTSLTEGAAVDWLIPFLKMDQELWERWTALPGRQPVGTPLQRLYVNQGGRTSTGASAHVAGYYCLKCGFRFGVDAEKVKAYLDREGRCHICQRVYQVT